MCGAKASPNGRTEYWYAVLFLDRIPQKTICDAVLSECESTRPGPKYWRKFARICFSVNILNGRLPGDLLMGLRSRIGRSPPSLLWRFSTAWFGTVHFWGVFHWVLYLVPGTFLVPPQPRFQANRTVTKT